MVKKKQSKKLEDSVGGVKPKTISFKEKVTKDKVFLLSLIDDPVRTFKAYGYYGDERLLKMLNGISDDVLNRAAIAFTEVGLSADASDGCRACQGCEACEAC